VLQFSCLKGNNNEVIQLLIDRGADINANSNDGDTPLHVATKEG
jgi:ankyrin repeat protein